MSVIKKILLISLLCCCTLAHADEDVISLFPLDNYDQNIASWIKASDPNYDKPLLSPAMQEKRLDIFYDHYFGTHSPWNENYVNEILQQPPQEGVKAIEISLLNLYDNANKPEKEIGYAENFRAYPKEWIEDIRKNIHLSQLEDLTFKRENRAIAIDNLNVRALPTDDVHFYSHKLPGQGYPFDNLQMSSLWVGTPVYVVADSKDHAWSLIIAPEYIGWVKSNGLAKADESFIRTWTNAAQNKLAAITKTKTAILDAKGNYEFTAYVGAIFPATATSSGIQLQIPSADADHFATIKYTTVANANAAIMPLPITLHNIANIMQTLIGRPYGWGNNYFYTDCSSELKSLFAPFGIWLPRNSSEQVAAGKLVDLSAASPEKRLNYLMENGQRFLTIIYVGSHIVLYIGNYADPNKPGDTMAMTYQNVWGLRPEPSTRRAVIGKSLFIPMLLQYPEDPTLISFAAKSYFQVAFLNQLPATNAPERLKPYIDIHALMYPEMLLWAE